MREGTQTLSVFNIRMAFIVVRCGEREADMAAAVPADNSGAWPEAMPVEVCGAFAWSETVGNSVGVVNEAPCVPGQRPAWAGPGRGRARPGRAEPGQRWVGGQAGPARTSRAQDGELAGRAASRRLCVMYRREVF